MINGNVERYSNLGNARLLTYIDNDETIFHFHVFDTKKDDISDKKFLISLFLFTFSSKFTLFSILFFLILHHNKLYFRSVFNYTLYPYPFDFPPFKLSFSRAVILSTAPFPQTLFACLLRSSPVMLSENKHWVYLIPTTICA